MIKQCGNCEFWDTDNAENLGDYSIAPCIYEIPPLPVSILVGKKTETAYCQGQDCPVYKEKEG